MKARLFKGINKDEIDLYFRCIIEVFHVFHGDSPIKESMWENVNEEIFKRLGMKVKDTSKGSHKSGKDMNVNGYSISNKSGLYKNKSNDNFSISSYRMAGVKYSNDDDIKPFIDEINKRKNFDYYSIIVRREIIEKVGALEVGKKMLYDWYLIPSDCCGFDPNLHKWSKNIGKSGKLKDKCNGWKTEKTKDGKYMDIKISTAYQLWFHVNKDSMKKYIVSSTIVNITEESGYFNMYKMLHRANPKKYNLRSHKLSS